MLHDVFISYTQPDRLTAFRVHDYLQITGLVSWIAVSETNGIQPGRGFEAELVKAIAASRNFVLIYSKFCNQSDNILRELRHRWDSQPTIVLRLDDTPFAPALSWYLKDLQHFEASGNQLDRALPRLLTAIRRAGAANQGSAAKSTDRILFEQGLNLLQQRRYAEAASLLEKYSDISPNDPNARFYLALAMIAARSTRKLDGILVRRLEQLLNTSDDAGNVLLAIIKEGYYAGNGFRVPPPLPTELMSNARISREAALALLTHLNESTNNSVWQAIQHYLNSYLPS